MVLQENQKRVYFIVKSASMQLMMFIGHDLIEAIPLSQENIPKPGYLGNIKRALKVKYNELIRQYAEKPEFLVIEPIKENKADNQDRIK